MEWLTWLQFIVLPSLGGLLYMILKIKAECEDHLSNLSREISDAKVEVARNYVANTRLKEVEDRITEHLIRIENNVIRLVEQIKHDR